MSASRDKTSDRHGLGWNDRDRVFGLDVLRAFAIGGVLLSHLHLVFWGGDSAFMAVFGTLGVELFFVLSGFLIGGLLLKIVERGASLRGWWIFLVRRWMRTLPLYYLWLVILVLGGTWTGATAWPWFFLTLAQNLAWPMTSDWFQVSWSLMVEEWFYLLFASTVLGVACLTRHRRRAVLLGCILFMILPLAARWMVRDVPAADWDAGMRKIVVLRLDAIAYGVVVAWLMRYRRARCEALALPALALGLLLLATGWFTSLQPASYGSPAWRVGFFCLVGAGFALCFPAVRRLVSPAGWIEAPVRWVSQRSYGMYIVHLTVMEQARQAVLDGVLHPRVGVAVACLASAALAELSYRCLELPILARRPPQEPRPAVNSLDASDVLSQR